MSWVESYFGDHCSPEDRSDILQEYVKQGLVEQYTDENGEFVFVLTEIGKRILNDLTAGDSEDEV